VGQEVRRQDRQKEGEEKVNATVEYEMHLEKIEKLKQEAWDAKTVGRSFNELADTIAALPTQGDLWDKARAELVRYAMDMGERTTRMSSANFAKAKIMEQQGIRPI
jgi:hypothetical protein